ncbi:proto-oncogene tyrosine-protein kinase ROS-like isoform X1 [Camponotus floridanus]|uniref:proto-oncogene tyrosine-protein kinase ROS-like isoform X1 n=1 Tax=Camponotus floridanus TaxID=104421 RepID=UPI000DC6CAE5|nr:proto-oncogene tyrosine-protein kinase ROS-like isoform X1 [Camponotus floridanus]
MQIMFGTILFVLLKGLILTKATITPEDYTTSSNLQKESVPMCPSLNFTQDISMSEKSDHHILNFKSDRSHSDSTVRNKREDHEVTHANISIIPESIENSLSRPTSLRAFVQFDSQFTEKVNDIFVTLRWNQPEFTEMIQEYQVQCSFFEDFKETCDDKNITATKLEQTVHNLTSNTTYYFRVRAHSKIVNKIVAGPYTDLIKVSTTHENPIPKLLLASNQGIKILDVDLNVTNFETSEILMNDRSLFVYSIQENRIYWITYNIWSGVLMTLKINENNITNIASFHNYPALDNLCIDWVARNLYFKYRDSDYSRIIKFDLTMWESGIIKFDEVFKSKNDNDRLNVLPSMGILYHTSYNWTDKEYGIMKYHFDGKIEQIVRINASLCLFHHKDPYRSMIIDDMNSEESLIYWLSGEHIFVTDINVSMCNTILNKKNIGDNIRFQTMTIDKTNIYILAYAGSIKYIYILKKKYVDLESVNVAEYFEKTILSSYKKNLFYGFILR